MDSTSRNILIPCILLGFFLTVLIKTAWVSDDAAITLRHVLNFINGYGPTFNVGERVQAYTHPLWFLLISSLSYLSNNVFLATLAWSLLFSVASLGLLMAKMTRFFYSGMLAASVLLFSKAFVDYSTSGLENPLSHFLLLLIMATAGKIFEGDRSTKSLVWFFLLCSMLFLNRQDLALLVFPAVLGVVFSMRNSLSALCKPLLIAASPVAAWLIFSIYYYGYPFPNTAYAKLGTGIETSERAVQGLMYLGQVLSQDPLTFLAIAVGAAIGICSYRRDRLGVFIASGVILYLIYIVYIGGDFMAGRFFTAPLLLSCIIIARTKIEKSELVVLYGVFALLGLKNLNSTALSGNEYDNRSFDRFGIADERGFYFQNYGLLTQKSVFTRKDWVLSEGSEIEVHVACGGLGYKAIASGPNAHYIDTCALADPLLSRLPAEYDPNWRVGHFTRTLPAGYIASVRENKNLLEEPSSHAFYDSVRLITRGDLNSPDRLREIMRMNMGLVESPDWELYRAGPR